MFDIEKYFYNIKDKLPEEGQAVLAYNHEIDGFIDAVYKKGKFFENGIELENITKWIENNSRIRF